MAYAAGKEVQQEFKIVPNKPDNIELALDTPPIESSTCKFEWDSTGATVEVWNSINFQILSVLIQISFKSY